MYKELSLLFSLFATSALCGPITTLPRRTVNTASLDILVPNSSGQLVRASAAQKRGIEKRGSELGTVTTIGNGQCKSGKADGSITSTCSLFCTVQSSIEYGDAKKASGDISCTLDGGCPASEANSVQITKGWSVSGGISFGGSLQDAVEGQAQLGGSYSWQKSVQSTSTYGFNPQKGDVGYIAFIPYMVESCGTLTVFEWSGEYYECLDFNTRKDGANFNNVKNYDPMSCGQTPKKLDSGEADGVWTFCNTQTGSGCP